MTPDNPESRRPPATRAIEARPETDAHHSSLAALTLGALGVVYGDIGTSPLYAFKEAFAGAHPLPLNEASVFGVLSLFFWALMLIVSFKYIVLVLRFDNRGEGGVLALLAYAQRVTQGNRRLQWWVGIMAIFAAALFYGDSVITPSISVLSAVEGLAVALPGFEKWIVPITLGVLVGLFALQHRGTGGIGKIFGPVTILWFLTQGALGLRSVLNNPGILAAIDPRHAAGFIASSPTAGFLVLGAVFLALTGTEALYADMGHFGRTPIRLAWFVLVLPALVLNYFGQGALVLADPRAAENPFFLLAPDWLLLPLVVLATAATVIASQATIAGAFSVTQQASRLGYLPRIPVTHTSASERGQIYIAKINWAMLAVVLVLVVSFGSSNNLAAAYGIAVSGTELLTTLLVSIVVYHTASATRVPLLGCLAVIACIEVMFFSSNATKIVAGGWFPLLVGVALFTVLSTWRTASRYLAARERENRLTFEDFLARSGDCQRVQGTAIYMTANADAVPATLLHVLKTFHVMHERIVVLCVETVDTPRVPNDERTEVRVIQPKTFYQVMVRYGFMENPDIREALHLLGRHGLTFDMMETTFFLGKSTIERAERRGWFTWRRDLFRVMQRNAPSAVEYFGLPPSRVVELGTRVSL